MKHYRIYYPFPISNNNTIVLPKADSHHLINVLRLTKDNEVNLFNQHGEWITKIIEANKIATKLLVTKQIKFKESLDKKINLFYAPLKNTPNGFLITKATELGVTEITQIITAQTTNKPLEIPKVELKAKQAAEQCGRLTLPKINYTTSLIDLLKNLNSPLLWLNEQQIGTNFVDAIKNNQFNNTTNLLVGPEGGFNIEEFNILSNNNFVIPVFLNGNILKAETAAIVAIALAVYT